VTYNRGLGVAAVGLVVAGSAKNLDETGEEARAADLLAVVVAVAGRGVVVVGAGLEVGGSGHGGGGEGKDGEGSSVLHIDGGWVWELEKF